MEAIQGAMVFVIVVVAIGLAISKAFRGTPLFESVLAAIVIVTIVAWLVAVQREDIDLGEPPDD